jgi:uncharacterized protein YggU (UPF0235/DUF167 family)
MPLKFEKITDAHRGAAFGVRIVIRTSKVEIAGVHEDGVLKIRLTEAHDAGAADKQLVQFLAEKLNINPSQLEVISASDKKNEKLILVDGLSPQDVEARLVP